MAAEGIIFLILAISIGGIQAGPFHTHTHADVLPAGSTEEWNITANMRPGSDNNPSWVITMEDRKDENTSVIATALDIIIHRRAKSGGLASTNGYQGITVRHVVNGHITGIDDIPKCKYPGLQKALVNKTSRRLTKFEKHFITCTIDSCGLKTIPTKCFTLPDPKKPQIL